ncbi:MAG: F0F1 ATP synthase subunit C [Ammonifex sp.]|jgi:F-type H+-transporting ATPase subunit c|nr:MAG: F0F1 ATP synthase subunit C [Ammonifex sp.]
MEVGAGAALGMALAAGLGALGAAIGDGIATGKCLESTARQPELRGQLMTIMFIGVGLIESIPIIAVVVAFMLMGKIGH